jgi:ribosome-associated translation inhibitor RaiA
MRAKPSVKENENEATMRKSDNQQRNAFRENVIHVGAGFVAKERPHVVATLSTLEPHLGKWDPREMDVDVTLQDRGGKEQRVTLRTSLPGRSPLVAVAENPDLTRALCEAKRDLIRQLEHQKSAREPMNNRRLRSATIRHPDPPRRSRSPSGQRRQTSTPGFRNPTSSPLAGR